MPASMHVTSSLPLAKKGRGRGHAICAARNCKNRRYDPKSKISFFRFPKDPSRAKIWLNRCNRDDLLYLDIDRLHTSYRLCQAHFDQKSFANLLRNRLHPAALPTMVPSLDVLTSEDHTYCRPGLVYVSGTYNNISSSDKKIRIIQEVIFSPDMSKVQLNKIGTRETEIEESSSENASFLTDQDEPSEVSLSPSPTVESQNIPHETFTELLNENIMLRKKLQELEKQQKNLVENITLPQYGQLTYKFFSKDVADFINSQIIGLPEGLCSDQMELEFKESKSIPPTHDKNALSSSGHKLCENLQE